MEAIQLMKDVFLIKTKNFQDDRGSFSITWNKKEFKDNIGIDFNPIQFNQSFSRKDTIRGLHFQLEPVSQSKLVTVSRGTIIDVIVNIQKNSPNFKDVFCVRMSAYKKEALFIPKGFAHGFRALDDDTVVNYLVDEEFVPSHQESINPLSLKTNVWDLYDDEVIISDKDKNGLDFNLFTGI